MGTLRNLVGIVGAGLLAVGLLYEPAQSEQLTKLEKREAVFEKKLNHIHLENKKIEVIINEMKEMDILKDYSSDDTAHGFLNALDELRRKSDARDSSLNELRTEKKVFDDELLNYGITGQLKHDLYKYKMQQSIKSSSLALGIFLSASYVLSFHYFQRSL